MWWIGQNGYAVCSLFSHIGSRTPLGTRLTIRDKVEDDFDAFVGYIPNFSYLHGPSTYALTLRLQTSVQTV